MSVSTDPGIKVMELIMQDTETLFGLQKKSMFYINYFDEASIF